VEYDALVRTRPPRFVPPIAALGLALAALLGGACGPSEKKHCKVNDQCFVCPDDKAFAACKRDPTSSRCKWTPPENCK
jgi:hypothetical protein